MWQRRNANETHSHLDRILHCRPRRDANANHSHLDSHPRPEPIVPIERVFERTFFLAKRDEASDLRDEASQKVLHNACFPWYNIHSEIN